MQVFISFWSLLKLVKLCGYVAREYDWLQSNNSRWQEFVRSSEMLSCTLFQRPFWQLANRSNTSAYYVCLCADKFACCFSPLAGQSTTYFLSLKLCHMWFFERAQKAAWQLFKQDLPICESERAFVHFSWAPLNSKRNRFAFWQGGSSSVKTTINGEG